MNAHLNPDVIRRSVVLKKIQVPNMEFEALVPTRSAPAQGFDPTLDWLKPEAISHETDSRGEHLVLWRKGERLTVYKGDAIFPLGPDGFTIVREEVVSYLRPAFYHMLHAEGHEPLSQGEAE